MTVAARLTLAEAAIARLIVSRGPRVSDLLKQARARSQQGEVVPPILHDVATLEAAARGRGLSAEMAKAQLRMLKGPPEAGAEVAYSRQDAVAEAGTGNPASSVAARSAGSTPPLASDSVVDRIDSLLAVYSRA